MKCPQCGTENKKGIKFCGNCGFSLANLNKANDNKSTTAETKKSGKTSTIIPVWIWIVFAVCLVILIGGGVLVLKAGSQNAQGAKASGGQADALNPDPACNRIGAVTDVSIPDATQIQSGQVFTKIWELTNGGTCTWDANYQVVFASGTYMGAYSPLKFGRTVQSGESIKIRMKMKAPAQIGAATGYWLLQTSTGTRFGFGEKGSDPFWIKISVVQ